MASDGFAGKPAFLGRGWSFPPRFDLHTGEVVMVEADPDIRESLYILLTTLPGERVMVPNYGCALQSFVFASLDANTQTQIRRLVSDAILFYEPRIDLQHIGVEIDMPNGVASLSIDYTVRRTNSRSNIVIPFCHDEGTNLTARRAAPPRL
ncbi:MAG: GPW/gp25 family protein [Paraburkholderia sp.]|uniref:GPW/gp25 family protein n=1 Tax=Paraburkholderia sp. TaxID=1926495 RepID=UPI00397CD556